MSFIACPMRGCGGKDKTGGRYGPVHDVTQDLPDNLIFLGNASMLQS